MLRRRQINGDPRGRAKRALTGLADLASWPFQRAAWGVERRLLWPLRERVAGRSVPAPGHRAGVAALAAIAAGAVLAGVLLLPGGGDSPSKRVAVPAQVAIAAPEPQPQDEPSGRELRGVAPSFGVGAGAGVSDADGGAGAELNAAGGEGTVASAPTTPSGEAAATSSSKKPVPAGPEAMKVARRFSEAFVFYEIGERPARAKTVFAETATPQLASALGERPPRQPAETSVPKARVVNLVPGPRAGKAYTVSVSLLRVGLTSELRLELNRKKGQWLITDVRG
jgi:hypothetical protein